MIFLFVYVVQLINYQMLFRLTRSTCWYRQKSLANTSFRFGFQKNGNNDETESISNNHPVIEEDGKNQNINAKNQKDSNLHKMNLEREN